MSSIQKSQIEAALGTVMEPDLGRDLMTLGMVEDIAVDEAGNVSFTVVLTTPACPMKESIKQSCINAIKQAVPEVGAINVNMTSKVTSSCSHGCGHGSHGAMVAMARTVVMAGTVRRRRSIFRTSRTSSPLLPARAVSASPPSR